MAFPKIAIVLINYRTTQLTLDCLASLEPEVKEHSETHVVVIDSASGDVTIIQKRTPKKKFEPGEYSLLTMIPVGIQPNNIVVKAFLVGPPQQ